MKALVVFYSFNGNTRLIAEAVAKAVDADLLELKPIKEIAPKGFMKYFCGGRAVIMNLMPELYRYNVNIDYYDVLFIGTPVWAWSYAPPLNTFLSTSKIEDKKIALFCCHGGVKGAIFRKMKAMLGNNTFLGEADFKEPLKRNADNNVKKAVEWSKDIFKDNKL
ncbi:MAG: flavodoxin [Candidatus Omnitrophica bacterium]|jgi:flavodoxin|nr:flavodoxin [Candidatus Omnitrophota bacterium]MDD5080935.1 flavodoxin [Candidatus Omnitrophota bacterium]MDD5440578.1 flavodoxin [Candidatus Omnitrophota bacterium]